ncbi:S-layer homology domain-containing protein [Paenibacillus sp. FSL L8-0506]|uniref:S-layer homology domain-containing protein n=1 Tax=Paenibacillus sp. FSL L8-0506 TaxID=2975335 RepID=UPI0030F99BA0
MSINKKLTVAGVVALSVSLLTGFTAQTSATGVVIKTDSEIIEIASATATKFKDLSSSHWAYNGIMNAVQSGYFKGYTDGTFKPSAPVTRAEFAVLMDRVSTNAAVTSGATFSDVPTSNWASGGIVGAISKGFIKPSDFNGSFKPAQQLTRMEMAKWMANGLSAGNAEYSQAMQDMAKTVVPVSEYYKGTLPSGNYGTVGLMMGTGLMAGMPDGSFGINQVTTRAEVAAILLRLEAVQQQQPSQFKNLVQMREVGTKGTNAESMGYGYLSFNGATYTPTFGADIWNKTINLKNGAGTIVMKHMIIINPDDSSSVYYPLFFGKGNHMDYRRIDKGYFAASLVTVVPARDDFTTKTVMDASGIEVIAGGGYDVGDAVKYGHPLVIQHKPFTFTKGVSKTYYTVSNIKNPSEMRSNYNLGVRLVSDKVVTLAAKEN